MSSGNKTDQGNVAAKAASWAKRLTTKVAGQVTSTVVGTLQTHKYDLAGLYLSPQGQPFLRVAKTSGGFAFSRIEQSGAWTSPAYVALLSGIDAKEFEERTGSKCVGLVQDAFLAKVKPGTQFEVEDNSPQGYATVQAAGEFVLVKFQGAGAGLLNLTRQALSEADRQATDPQFARKQQEQQHAKESLGAVQALHKQYEAALKDAKWDDARDLFAQIGGLRDDLLSQQEHARDHAALQKFSDAYLALLFAQANNAQGHPAHAMQLLKLVQVRQPERAALLASALVAQVPEQSVKQYERWLAIAVVLERLAIPVAHESLLLERKGKTAIDGALRISHFTSALFGPQLQGQAQAQKLQLVQWLSQALDKRPELELDAVESLLATGSFEALHAFLQQKPHLFNTRLAVTQAPSAQDENLVIHLLLWLVGGQEDTTVAKPAANSVMQLPEMSVRSRNRASARSMVNWLATHGADLNDRPPRAASTYSPYRLAKRLDDEALLNALIERGAKPFADDLTDQRILRRYQAYSTGIEQVQPHVGSGRYGYYFLLVDDIAQVVLPNTLYRVTLGHPFLPLDTRNQFLVYEGTTDAQGRTAVFFSDAPYEIDKDKDAAIQKKIGTGKYGTSFDLERPYNPYELVMPDGEKIRSVTDARGHTYAIALPSPDASVGIKVLAQREQDNPEQAMRLKIRTELGLQVGEWVK